MARAKKAAKTCLLLVLFAASLTTLYLSRHDWRIPLSAWRAEDSLALQWRHFEQATERLIDHSPRPDETPTEAAPEAPEETPPPKSQIEQYAAEIPKSIVELQQYRRMTAVKIHDKSNRQGRAGLVNLNPAINSWFLLRVQWDDRRDGGVFHLENPRPETQKVMLDPEYPYGVVLATPTGQTACELWGDDALANAAVTRQPYVELCDKRMYLRNRTKGFKTNKEVVTDFLRDYIPQGEKIVVFIREKFFKDAFWETGKVASSDEPSAPIEAQWEDEPAAALISPHYENSTIVPDGLGFELENAKDGKIAPGRWYRVKGAPGVYLSAIRPDMVSEEVVKGLKKYTRGLDDVEQKALVYLVAFDMDQFEFGFGMGTEHPRVDWSDRITPNMRSPSLPGPDGIGSTEPVVNTGMISPALTDRVVASFVGGFKRYHGAFKWGPFATKNHGTHYGFVEHGVVMSKLQRGLATFVVWNDGRVELKTWTAADDENLGRVRHARQNGVPIIDFDEKDAQPFVHPLVLSWTSGNWSGSQDKKYRTLRGSLAWQEDGEARYLIYGYFSSATPSALARIYQAYSVRYAMLLDMNALEFTYCAVYPGRQPHAVQHLIKGMNILDKGAGEALKRRFIDQSDARDYFYVYERTLH